MEKKNEIKKDVYTLKSKPTTQYPNLDSLKNTYQDKARLPLLHKPADWKDLPYLSDDEKKWLDEMWLGASNINGHEVVQSHALLAHDPKLFKIFAVDWSFNLTALSYEGDPSLDQCIPGTLQNLMSLRVCKYHECQCLWFSFLFWGTGIKTWDGLKLLQMDFPDHDIWDDEERLILKFTNAVVEHKMTDDLFKEAVDAWGPQLVLRKIAYIGMLATWCYLLNTCNVESPAFSPYVGKDDGLTPENHRFTQVANELLSIGPHDLPEGDEAFVWPNLLQKHYQENWGEPNWHKSTIARTKNK
ncbi:MAG: hypothetical protein HKP58_18950 [Desulfatitalea sp.]|nr:hypothetical protein [Desulfatitalea sp.]NNK02494.1 hypothetical protein [Desulfatitalea sp.]